MWLGEGGFGDPGWRERRVGTGVRRQYGGWRACTQEEERKRKSAFMGPWQWAVGRRWDGARGSGGWGMGWGGKRAGGGAGGCASHPAPTACPAAAPGSPFSAVLPQPPERWQTGRLPGHGLYGSALLGNGPRVTPHSRGHPGQAFCLGQSPASPASPSSCWHSRGSRLGVRARTPGLERTTRVTPGNVTSAVLSPSTERKDAGNPPQYALLCPCRLGASDMVTRPLPVSHVSLQGEGP